MSDIGFLDKDEQDFYRYQEVIYGDFGAEMMYLYNPRRWTAEMGDWEA